MKIVVDTPDWGGRLVPDTVALSTDKGYTAGIVPASWLPGRRRMLAAAVDGPISARLKPAYGSAGDIRALTDTDTLTDIRALTDADMEAVGVLSDMFGDDVATIAVWWGARFGQDTDAIVGAMRTLRTFPALCHVDRSTGFTTVEAVLRVARACHVAPGTAMSWLHDIMGDGSLASARWWWHKPIAVQKAIVRLAENYSCWGQAWLAAFHHRPDMLSPALFPRDPDGNIPDVPDVPFAMSSLWVSLVHNCPTWPPHDGGRDTARRDGPLFDRVSSDPPSDMLHVIAATRACWGEKVTDASVAAVVDMMDSDSCRCTEGDVVLARIAVSALASAGGPDVSDPRLTLTIMGVDVEAPPFTHPDR